MIFVIQNCGGFFFEVRTELLRIYCLHHQGCRSDDRGNKLLRNVGQYPPDCMAQRSATQTFSFSLRDNLNYRQGNTNSLLRKNKNKNTDTVLKNRTQWFSINVLECVAYCDIGALYQ